MPKPILFSVDDDFDVLRAIERDLRSQYGADYRVIGSDAPEKALEIVKQLKVRSDSVALLLAERPPARVTTVRWRGSHNPGRLATCTCDRERVLGSPNGNLTAQLCRSALYRLVKNCVNRRASFRPAPMRHRPRQNQFERILVFHVNFNFL